MNSQAEPPHEDKKGDENLKACGSSLKEEGYRSDQNKAQSPSSVDDGVIFLDKSKNKDDMHIKKDRNSCINDVFNHVDLDWD